MKTLEEFSTFYATDLRPLLVAMDQQRKAVLQKFRSAALLIVLGGAVVGLGVAAAGLKPVFLLIPLALTLVGSGIAWWFTTRKFAPQFKDKVIRRIVQFTDTGLQYDPNRFIPRPTFRSSKIFTHGIDRYRGEDWVGGVVGQTAIEFSEVHAEYRTTSTDSKGRTRTQWHTIFKGLYFVADFNKDFNGMTLVLPDVAERLFGFLGKKLQAWNFTREELVKLEDPEFEKLFVVYGSDQIETRYILSPSLMKRIVEFKKKRGLKIHLSFVGSCVHLAISTRKNMLEPSILGTVLDFEKARAFFEDLQFAVGIVDELNLNTRIWSKQ